MTTVRSTRARDSLATSAVVARRRQQLSRRRLLQATGGLALAAGLGTTSQPTSVAAQGNVGGTLTMLCWQGYDGPNANKPFIEQTGTKINAIYLGSNDEVSARSTSSPPTTAM
jgi:spermidine/putrescine-binding protein